MRSTPGLKARAGFPSRRASKESMSSSQEQAVASGEAWHSPLPAWAPSSHSPTSVWKDWKRPVSLSQCDTIVERLIGLKMPQGADNVIIFKCDVSNKEDIAEAKRVCTAKFGDVSILINNAGIVSGKKVLENSEFMIEKTLQVNTLAHLWTIRAFLPGML